ncbi:hemolysin family protein [Leptolyngbya sp. AN02str]|uniref:hemolysin family protein n=1 Tax=Leptolyngbya sp. AN02str TaxID=3423363 RepID=UPI003D317237
MSTIALEVFIVLLLILANAVFVLSEMAVVSARKARLQEMAERGNLKAEAALSLANEPNHFLSTVQIGITLIGILTGTFGGATIAAPLAEIMRQVPQLARYSQAIAIALVVISITYFTLIIGELVPKRLALRSPERIAASIAQPMSVLSSVAYPVVKLLSWSTDTVLKLLGIESHHTDPMVTEDEIKVLIRQGTEAGMFEEAEQDMVERVFHLGDQSASSLMTPRLDVVWLDLNDSDDENRRKIIEHGHTRFPVCQGSLDTVLGIVHITDLISLTLTNQPINFVDCLRQPLYIPESTPALKILELFKQSGTHMAIAVDEYGVIQGVVTLNDVMEIIMGDLPFIDHNFESPMIQRDDGSWLLDGMLPIDRLKDLLDLETLPGEDRGTFQTLGGFVVTQLGRIPSSADSFEWEGFQFEVMDMDGNRVDKVLLAADHRIIHPNG